MNDRIDRRIFLELAAASAASLTTAGAPVPRPKPKPPKPVPMPEPKPPVPPGARKRALVGRRVEECWTADGRTFQTWRDQDTGLLFEASWTGSEDLVVRALP